MADAFSGWEWFYLDDEGENQGPFSTEELAAFYADGGLNDESYVWAEECEGWEQIGVFQAFKEAILALNAPAAPSAPPAEPAGSVPEEKVTAVKEQMKAVAQRRTSMSKPPSSSDKAPITMLKELSQKRYQDQAMWFLNAYWNAEGKKILFQGNDAECERVWGMCNAMAELDKAHGKEGHELPCARVDERPRLDRRLDREGGHVADAVRRARLAVVLDLLHMYAHDAALGRCLSHRRRLPPTARLSSRTY